MRKRNAPKAHDREDLTTTHTAFHLLLGVGKDGSRSQAMSPRLSAEVSDQWRPVDRGWLRSARDLQFPSFGSMIVDRRPFRTLCILNSWMPACLLVWGKVLLQRYFTAAYILSYVYNLFDSLPDLPDDKRARTLTHKCYSSSSQPDSLGSDSVQFQSF